MVPVDMMEAHSYPLRWFSREQPEIQVTLDCPDWAWVLGGGEGSREAVEQARGGEVGLYLPCSYVPGAHGSKRSPMPTQGD